MTIRTDRISNPTPAVCPVAPELAAFRDLKAAKIFDAKLPKSVDGSNWLDASPVVLAGIGAAGAQILASRGIKTLREVALCRALWTEFGKYAKPLQKAHDAILKAVEKNNVNLDGRAPAVNVVRVHDIIENKTVEVPKGSDLVLSIKAPSHGSTGLAWKAFAERQFGSPTSIEFMADQVARDLPGGSGSQETTWRLDSPFHTPGRIFKVEMKLAHADGTLEPGTKSFKFKVKIV